MGPIERALGAERRLQAARLLDVLVLAVFLLLPLQHPRLHPRVTVGDILLVLAAVVALVAPPPPTTLRELLGRARPVALGLGLVLVGGLVGLVAAGEPALSAGLLVRLLGTVAICGWLVWRWAPGAEQAWLALAAMVLSAAVSGALGIVGVVGSVGFDLQSAAGRAQGLAGNANLFGAVGAVCFAIGCVLALTARRPWWWAVPLVALLGGVAWSASRSAALGIVVGVAPLAVHLVRRWPRRAAALAGVAALLVLVGLVGLVRVPVVDRALERTDTPASEGGERSREARVDFLRDGVEERGGAQSLLVGSGLRDDHPSLHSGVAEVWVGLGVLGLVGWLLVLGWLVRPAVGVAVRAGPLDVSAAPLVAASTGLLAYLGCALLVDNVWNRYIWLLAALVLVLDRGEPRDRADAEAAGT